MGLAAPVCISATPEELEYADKIAKQLGTNRSDVYRRCLRLMKKARHDYATPLNGMMLVADALERGLMNRKEVASTIRSLVKQMDALAREEASPEGEEPDYK